MAPKSAMKKASAMKASPMKAKPAAREQAPKTQKTKNYKPVKKAAQKAKTKQAAEAEYLEKRVHKLEKVVAHLVNGLSQSHIGPHVQAAARTTRDAFHLWY